MIMRKINYRFVFNRKKKLNNMGTALIQIEAYYERNKAYFSTDIYVRPDQWDAKRSMIINHPQAEELNRFKEEMILTFQWKELQSWKQGKVINLALLNDFSSIQRPRVDNVCSYGQKWIESSGRRDSTKKNMTSTLKLLQQFNADLTFDEVNYGCIVDFERFLREKRLKVNTVAKHLKQLRTLLNEAVRQDLLSADAYPFKKFRIKTTEGRHAFLMPKELLRLERLSNERNEGTLWHTLDAFLFCCYTGLRYSDFVQQTVQNIIRENGHTWLVFSSVKTKVESRLPLDLLFDGKPLIILKRYLHHESDFFKLPSNSLVNKHLVRLGQMAKIEKHFSFHSARHTNATLLIYNGAQITTVQKLLGHRNVKTTQVYSDVFAETIIKDLKKCKF